MEQELIKLQHDASSLIIAAEDEKELNEIKLDFLGKSGRLTILLKDIKKVPEDRRPEVGRLANEILSSVEELVNRRIAEFTGKKHEKIKDAFLDVTLPGIKPPLGHLHLITQAIDEISDIFSRIGFERVRHPEVEWDWYAFGALNFPEQHPARDDWETFFIATDPDPKHGNMLLTPHTSNGQVREMLKKVKSRSAGEPINIKMLNIAKTYRRQSDVSHSQIFHQFETLVVGENMSIANLKGTLDYFVKSWFGPDRKTRIRPYHFQFTEPSFETDVSCGVCGGTGKLANNDKCRVCKEGWLEIGGAGIVHPNVLKAGGIDPNKYTGFASGWGVERVLMMREGLELDDLRTIYSNNLDFLEQF